MNPPHAHGGSLCQLLRPVSERESLIRETATLPAHTLNAAQLCTLEALLNGSLSPLCGYMDEANYLSVLASQRLISGLAMPVPLTLAVSQATLDSLGEGDQLLLRDEEGTPLALLAVSGFYRPDKLAEARVLFGSDHLQDPAVGALLATDEFYVAGKLDGIQLPKHYDFTHWRQQPTQIRAAANEGELLGFASVFPAFGGLEGQLAALAAQLKMKLLIGFAAGSDALEPVPYAVRARLANSFVKRLATVDASAVLLPLERVAASPRDLLLRILVLRNYGCTAVAVEQAAESPEALALVGDFAEVCGIAVHLLAPQAWSAQDTAWVNAHGQVAENALDSRSLFEHLVSGLPLLPWMVHPQDITDLGQAFPPRAQQGLVLFFTGLSGAGKSTVAKALTAALGAYRRPVTLLDGDIVRLNLSKGLGFSKEDRDLNIMRIGYVASLVARSGGLAICAPIAPYRKTRAAVRRLMGNHGRFVEVHVATDLAVCESRDPKGLYARARAGLLKGFTGIDDPYEAPEDPELRLDTGKLSVAESIETVLSWLSAEGYLN